MKELYISEDIDFSLDELIGKCIGILGIRGSGKSNTAGVIFEELLKHNYPLTVVDIDGEYFGLKEEYELLVIGQGENVDIEIEPEDAAQVAEISIKKSIPVVLDLSGFLKEEQRTMLKGYFTDLWNWAGKLRKPYMIGIEESHEFIPQGKNVFPLMTVRENLELGTFIRSDEGYFEKNIEQVYEMFPILEEKKSDRASTLSGGQLQMMEMGRAMLLTPQLVLIDEPSLGLAPKLAKGVFDKIETLKEEGTTILIVEQNADRSLRMSDYAYVIEAGENKYKGNAEEIRNDEEIKRSYLGG